MKRTHIRFLSGVVMVVTGLATAGPRPTLRAQAQLPRFEVASVKQNTSGEPAVRMQTSPGGRLVITNALLRGLIGTAFDLADSPAQVRVRVLGGPEWVDTARFDINAKAAAEFQFGPGGPPSDMLLMMRSLLEDRFKLVAHRETRELPIYELVLARADGKLGPGLHKSDVDCDAVFAARRAGVLPPPRQILEPPPCGLMGGPARTIAGGVLIQQLATNLAARLERPVIDKTGLTGRFDFHLAFTPDRIPTQAPPPGVPPIDPNGPSLFTALQEQLGLKLVSTKGPVDVLVIDRIEHPTPD